MDDREQQRKLRHCLAVLRRAEEVSGNVAATCRYYGISRTLFYKWRNRYEQLGGDGLRDRSSRPHDSPTATKGEVVERIVHLRQNCHFGSARIAMYLKRYHDVEIFSSGVWRVLHRLGLGRPPANQRCQRRTQRPKRYEKQRPGHRVQIDVKFIAPIDGVTTKRHCPLPAIDDCTRLRVLRVYPQADQRTAIAFLDYVTERLPFPIEVIQTDNGAEFQTGFGWHVLDRGIGHVYIKPATPRLNGKVERSHRFDAEESSAGCSKASPSTTPICSTDGDPLVGPAVMGVGRL